MDQGFSPLIWWTSRLKIAPLILFLPKNVFPRTHLHALKKQDNLHEFSFKNSSTCKCMVEKNGKINILPQNS